jgi:hypothetical protein
MTPFPDKPEPKRCFSQSRRGHGGKDRGMRGCFPKGNVEKILNAGPGADGMVFAACQMLRADPGVFAKKVPIDCRFGPWYEKPLKG